MDLKNPPDDSFAAKGAPGTLIPPASVYAAAILPAFAFRFFTHQQILIAVCAGCIAIGLLYIAKTSRAETLMDAFKISLVLLLLVAATKSTMLIAAGWAVWTVRNAALRLAPGMGEEYPLRQFFLGWASAFVLLLWSSGEPSDFISLAVIGAILATVAAITRPLLAGGNRAPWAEFAGVAVIATFSGFNPFNLVYLKMPYLALFLASLSAFFFFKADILDRMSALVFGLYGTLIYFATGEEAFVLFFLFNLICDAGRRLSRRGRNRGNVISVTPGRYALQSLPAIVIVVISVGADDPFPFYLAFTGALATVTFHTWGGEIPSSGEESATTALEPVTPKKIALGILGTSLLGFSAWATTLLPAGALPVIVIAGAASPLLQLLKTGLANPVRDLPWLRAVTGAGAVMLLSNLFLPI